MHGLSEQKETVVIPVPSSLVSKAAQSSCQHLAQEEELWEGANRPTGETNSTGRKESETECGWCVEFRAGKVGMGMGGREGRPCSCRTPAVGQAPCESHSHLLPSPGLPNSLGRRLS